MATGPANTLAAHTEAAGRPLKMTYPTMPNGTPGQVLGMATHFTIAKNSQAPRRGSKIY